MTQIPAYQYDEVVADNGRLLGEIAALSRELEVARECHVEKLERALKAEAEVNRLRIALTGMVESYDVVMQLALPTTMVDVVRSVFVFEIGRARDTLKQEG